MHDLSRKNSHLTWFFVVNSFERQSTKSTINYSPKSLTAFRNNLVSVWMISPGDLREQQPPAAAYIHVTSKLVRCCPYIRFYVLVPLGEPAAELSSRPLQLMLMTLAKSAVISHWDLSHVLFLFRQRFDRFVGPFFRLLWLFKALFLFIHLFIFLDEIIIVCNYLV